MRCKKNIIQDSKNCDINIHTLNISMELLIATTVEKLMCQFIFKLPEYEIIQNVSLFNNTNETNVNLSSIWDYVLLEDFTQADLPIQHAVEFLSYPSENFWFSFKELTQ